MSRTKSGSRPKDYGSGFFRVVLRYGFMEEIDVPAALAQLKDIGPQCKMMDTSFFLARQTLLASSRPGMAIWREKLFAWMLRNAESAMEFFKLPTNRVVELGQPGRNLNLRGASAHCAPPWLTSFPGSRPSRPSSPRR